MTRIFTDGAEFGDCLFFSSYDRFIVSPTARSGSYSYNNNNNVATYNAIKSFAGLSEFYFRMAFRIAVQGIARTIAQFRKGTTIIGTIYYDGTYLNYRVGSSSLCTATYALVVNTWYLIEVHVKIADSGGIAELKIDGALQESFSGDTKPGADTTIDNIRLGITTGSGSVHAYWDDLALNDVNGGVDDSWCGDGRIILLTPNAAGDSTQWTPSAGANYTCVDEAVANGDTDYIEDAVLDEKDLYGLSNCGLSDVDIKRIWVEARARDTEGAGGLIALILKSGSTEIDTDDLSLLTTYTIPLISDIHIINPDTSLAWTVSDLDSLQAGVKVRS